MSQEFALNNLGEWQKELWQRLQSHQIPENERRITITEASNLTGLSKMQLSWLRLRRVVSICSHPTLKWRGQPVATYAVSEMEITRQVYEEHKARTKS